VETYSQALHKKKRRTSLSVLGHPATVDDITILMPVYKPGPDILETIDSICNQTAGTPRVVICDDGTPAAEKPWLDYASARLSHCPIFSQPNSGLLASRNALLEECCTKLSLFLDADDLLAPNALEVMLQAYNNSPFPIDAVIPARHNFGDSTELVSRHRLHDYSHFQFNDYRMTALISTEALKNIGFDSSRRNGEADDWVFWLQFACSGRRAIMVALPIFYYRFRKGSMSWPWSQGQAVGTATMIREVIQDVIVNQPHHAAAIATAFHRAHTQHLSKT
jgi:glycosyltransferase involved in cell wall biosynthesis